MSKPYSEDDLASQLSLDLTWRLREISDLKAAVLAADIIARPALLRAVVTIAYAHWEGHVRFAAKKYLTHIALRKLRFSDLSAQFLRNDFLPRLAVISQKNIEERGNLVDSILSAGDEKFSRVNDELINTKANLNSEVISDICRVCNLSPSLFAGQEAFIDVILLKRRNSIAHGEETFLDVGELDDVTDGTISLMRIFSNELQSNAYLGSYRAA